MMATRKRSKASKSGDNILPVNNVREEKTTVKSSNVNANQFVENMSIKADEIFEEKHVRNMPEIETQRISPSTQSRVIDQTDRMKAEDVNLRGQGNFKTDEDINRGLNVGKETFKDDKFDNHWGIDPNLHTGPRILVPVDVQALVVPKPVSSTKSKSNSRSPPSSVDFTIPISEKSILTSNATRADLHVTLKENQDRNDVYSLPGPFDQESNPATSLEPGIHLFWALPDSLMRGDESESSIEDEDDEYLELDHQVPPEIAGSRTGISYSEAIRDSIEFEVEDDVMDLSDFDFPQLPDRWLIVRQWKSGRTLMTKKWVLESDTGSSDTLETWSSPGKSTASPEMTAVGPGAGDIYWTVTYDSARNRFTFHDTPEDHVVGPFDYLVAGWYSDETQDPLWMPMSTAETDWMSYFEDELRWKLPEPWLGGMVDGDPDLDYTVFPMPSNFKIKDGDS